MVDSYCIEKEQRGEQKTIYVKVRCLGFGGDSFQKIKFFYEI